jgi:hypothetical protein
MVERALLAYRLPICRSNDSRMAAPSRPVSRRRLGGVVTQPRVEASAGMITTSSSRAWWGTADVPDARSGGRPDCSGRPPKVMARPAYTTCCTASRRVCWGISPRCSCTRCTACETWVAPSSATAFGTQRSTVEGSAAVLPCQPRCRAPCSEEQFERERSPLLLNIRREGVPV